MAANGLVPDVLSLIVCDQIIADRLTGKQSLIGMFSRIHAAQFPATQPHLCIYVALTDGRGKTPMVIRVVDSDDVRPPVVRGQGVVDFKNPRAVANLSLQFYGLVFPEPGQYRVQISCHGTLLREARLELVRARRRPRQPQAPAGA